MKCTVKSVVYYEHNQNDFVIEHYHSCYECVFYMEGEGAISVEKDVYTYKGPTLTVIAPNVLHDEKTNQKSKLFIVLFEIDDDSLFKSFNFYKLDDNTSKELIRLFEQLIEEEKEKGPLYQEVISSIFSVGLYRTIRKHIGIKVSANKELVERTKNYVKENYRQDIDFEKIASNFGYSFDRFRHIFKQETGISIHQYLLNCRLYASKQLLLNPNITVKEIARQCGFDSVVHFNNFFKLRMNTTPLQFRKSSMLPIDKGVFKIDNTLNKTLIIDTDIGGDCDDAGALALANIFYLNNKIDIACMTYTTSSEYGPCDIDAINKFYGNQFEIGMTYRKDYHLEHHKFQEVLAKEYDNDFYDKNKNITIKAQDAVSLIRRKLSEASDSSVTITCIGQLNNASDLLNSKGDEYSPLDGVQLVKKKVKEFVVMGGLFKEDDQPVIFEGVEYGSEYNIACDIVSAQNFVKKCPVKIYFVDFLTGYKIKTGAKLLKQNNINNPVTKAYQLFQNGPRQSWDLLAIWFAVFGKCNFFKVTKEGFVSVSDDGTTTFDEDKKCGHYLVKVIADPNMIIEKIDTTLVKEIE